MAQGAIWELNREIVFEFNEAVDFASVSLNTINIQSEAGEPASGSFAFARVDADGDGQAELVDETVLIFTPKCPSRSDFADAGLLPGGVPYRLTVDGIDSGSPNVVRSTTNRPLEQSQTRRFRTPVAIDPALLFVDDVAGPPMPIVREVGSSELASTYLEIGGDDANRVYLEFDPSTGTLATDPAGFELPLNLLSDRSSAVALVVELNQPVSPIESNVSSNRLRFEFSDNGSWKPLDTRVELEANCTETGARVRLEPVSILPRERQVRVVILPGFQDLVGEANGQIVTGFARAPTRTPAFETLDPSTESSDELLEEFDLSADFPRSLEDPEAFFDAPRADWEGGRLVSAFDFQGDGGPGGNFDWIVRSGDEQTLDTLTGAIVGGPGGVPTAVQQITAGTVDVRDLIVEAGAELRLLGSRNLTIRATGDVILRGRVDISGFSAKNVATLNTGSQVEVGAAGAAGGGRGGDGSPVTNNSSPSGTPGAGPFDFPGVGGKGGESAYATGNQDRRRPGGGGGGRLGRDQGGELLAEDGFPGHPNSTGAIYNEMPARGGEAGAGPIPDGNPDNDFFGARAVYDGTGAVVGRIEGELRGFLAGYGGGGGGDAIPGPRFPSANWNQGSDEKGGGGGGGAGGLRIRALGSIVIGSSALLRARGGRGAAGENTSGLDHVGGTGGSGSGGHFILESAKRIDFTDGDPTQLAREVILNKGGPRSTGPQTGVPVNVSYGGAGGPGIVQLHVPSPATPSADPTTSNLVVPLDALSAPDPLNVLSSPPPEVLLPMFGARSLARSRWVSIGAADVRGSDPASLVRFMFDGVETTPGEDEGKVRVNGTQIPELDPILGPVPFPTSEIAVEEDGGGITLEGSALLPLIGNGQGSAPSDIYLRTPALLRNFALRLEVVGNPAGGRELEVSEASYDDASQRLRIRLALQGESLLDFLALNPGSEHRLSLVPRFFRVLTGTQADTLPNSAYVRVRFQATGEDPIGLPDEENILVDWTADVARFNALQPGDLRFFRFEVEFQLDAENEGLSRDTNPVGLDFLRLPFRF